MQVGVTEGLILHPNTREIKANHCRTFVFAMERSTISFPLLQFMLSPASPPRPTGKEPMGARPLGGWTSWVFRALGIHGLRQGDGGHPKAGRWSPPCWFGVSCPTRRWGTRRSTKVGPGEPSLARGHQQPSGVMCSWILFKSARREDSSEHWINSTFSLSLALSFFFLLGK